MRPGQLIPCRVTWTRMPGGFVFCLMAALLTMMGCSRDIAKEASDSDANGYLCTKCSAKLYTDRSVFLPAICPKCKAEGIVEVVGFVCEKDNHLTLVGRSSARGGPACEKCAAPLSSMRLPREKEPEEQKSWLTKFIEESIDSVQRTMAKIQKWLRDLFRKMFRVSGGGSGIGVSLISLASYTGIALCIGLILFLLWKQRRNLRITMVAAQPLTAWTRRSVAWNGLVPSRSGRNCLG